MLEQIANTIVQGGCTGPYFKQSQVTLSDAAKQAEPILTKFLSAMNDAAVNDFASPSLPIVTVKHPKLK